MNRRPTVKKSTAAKPKKKGMKKLKKKLAFKAKQKALNRAAREKNQFAAREHELELQHRQHVAEKLESMTDFARRLVK